MSWFVDKLGPMPGAGAAPTPKANGGQPQQAARQAQSAPPPKSAPPQQAQPQRSAAPPPKAPEPEPPKKKKGWF
jgi:hypothetical protein